MPLDLMRASDRVRAHKLRSSTLPYNNATYWRNLHLRHAGRLTAVGFDSLGEGFNKVTYRLRLEACERLLLRNRDAPMSDVLEAAVGVGAYAPVWARLGLKNWTGIDISESAIAAITKRHPGHRFLVGDLRREGCGTKSLDGESFDLVTAIDVLYHLVDEGDLEMALVNLGSRVRPGGYLLVSDVFCDRRRQVAAHVVRRPLETYSRLLAPHGLTIVDREPVYAILGDPAPRSGFHPSDQALRAAWLMVRRAIRSTPTIVKDVIGSALARLLSPLDELIRRTGVTRGVNLELALFEKPRNNREMGC